MLRPRLTPVLLLQDNRLIKTMKFKNSRYLGDPLNTIKIFNEKKADEIVVLDISASTNNLEPDYKRVEFFANECRMPVTYGGGIKTLDHIEKIISLGVEKVCISSGYFQNINLIKEASQLIGSQSISLVIDFKKEFLTGKYSQYIFNGKQKVKQAIPDTIIQAQDQGVGEIIFNSIDFDGTRKGFDLDFLYSISKYINVPFTIVGGAGEDKHFIEASKQCSSIRGNNFALGAGSFFVFKGNLQAVLVTYPNYDHKLSLLGIS